MRKIKQFIKNTFYGFIWILAFVSFNILFPYKAVGNKKLKNTYGVVLCFNHVSIIDVVFILLTSYHRVNFMAKEELFKNKLAGWFFRYLDVFPVSRATGDRSAINRAEKVIRWGRVLGIFVEGARTKNLDGRPGKAKSGAAYIAASTGADIIPVAIIYEKGHPKLFRRVTIRYGDIIKNKEISDCKNSREGIRNATNTIMGKITELWDEGI